MTIIKKSHLGGVLAAASLAHPAWAQEDLDLGTLVLPAGQDEAQTTAESYRAETSTSVTGISAPIEEIPQSITVIPRAVLDDQLAQDPSDVLRNVPGVEGKTSKERTQQLDGDYLVRGQFTEAYVNGRSTFLDQGFDPESLINIERIEVLKGPTAALFDAANGAPPGGVVNLVEKSPQPDAFSTFGLILNSDGNAGLTFDINRPLTEDQTWMFRVTGHGEGGEDDLDLDSSAFSIYPTLRFDNGTTQATLRARYQQSDFDFYNGLPVFNGTIAPGLALDTVLAANDQPTNTTISYGVSLDVSHDFSESLTGRAAIGWHMADGDQFNSLYTFDGVNFNRADYSQFLELEIFDVSAGLVWETQPTASWEHTLSADISHQRTTERGSANFVFGAGSDPNFNVVNAQPFLLNGAFAFPSVVDGDYETNSFNVLSKSTVGDRFHVLGGVTFSNIDISYAPVPDVNEDVTSYRIGFAYDLTDALTPFIGYSEGFRAPRGITDPRTATVAVALETNKQAEIGLRFNFEQANLSGSVAAYRLDRDDASLFSDIGAEVIDLRSEGVEMEMVWQATANLAILANYAYTDARVRDPISPNNGNRAQRVPEHSGRVAARYDITSGAWDGLGFGLGYTFFSSRAGDLANTFFAPSVGVFDAQVSYERGNMRAALGIENLLDERDLAPNFYFNGNLGQIKPLTAIASVEWTF
ncbi:MAG: TonB-dependent siderophore receptor [Pseudomonadota bacterium]